MLVLALLNNEFVLKILNSTPFGQKIHKGFWPKNHKSQFSAYLSGFRALLFLYKVSYFQILHIFVLIHQKSNKLIRRDKTNFWAKVDIEV